MPRASADASTQSLAISAAAFTALLAPALSGRAVLAFRDMLQNYWPMKAAFWGDPGLPTWNRWLFTGMPLLGDLVQQPLYLPNLLFRALRMPAWPGIAWYLWLHGLLALLGTYALLRRVARADAAAFGAGTFLLGGFLVSDLSNLNWYCAAAWAPLSLLAADRVAREGGVRDGALLAVVLAQVVLASDPQLALLLGPCALALLAVRRAPLRPRLSALLIAGTGAVLLCLPQAIASLHLLPLVTRASALDSVALREQWSFHPARIPELWVPRLYGPLFDDGYWGGFTVQAPWKRPFIQSVYAGALWPALACAALLRRRRAALLAFAGLAGVGLLALGAHGFHLYSVLGRAVPTWSLYRYPERLLLLPALAAAVIATLGIESLPLLSRSTRLGLFAGSAALGLVSLAASGWLAPSHPMFDPAARTAIARSAAQILTVALLGCLVLLAHRRVPLLLSLLFAADLCAANGELAGLLPREPFREPPRICEAIRQRAGALPAALYRTFDDQAGLRDRPGRVPPEVASALPAWGRSRWLDYQRGKRNTLNLCGLRSAIALTSLEPRDVSALWRAAGPHRTLLASSVRFAVTSPGSPLLHEPGVRGFPAEDVLLLDFPDALPRLYRPERAAQGDAAEVLSRAAREPSVLTRALAIVSGPLAPHEPAPRARMLSFEDEGGRIAFAVEQESPGYWVLTDSLDDTWRAEVDGAAAPLVSSDVAHRAIWIPAGRHAIALRAEPSRVTALYLFSLLVLGSLLLTASRAGQASRRMPGAAI